MTDSQQGLALLCDQNGIIVQVLRNDLNLVEAVPGRLLARLAERSSRHRAMQFLADISANGSVLNRDWNVLLPTGLASLYFSGTLVEGQIVVVAATNNKMAAQLYEGVIQISNEQVNMLREAIKINADQAENELDLYDEISRLNNDLITMQRELAQKNIELEHLNREKNRFLSIAAHDLRSPLQAILMQSEFLLEFATSDMLPKHREFLADIHTSSQFITNLVDDLLDVTKIEAQQMPLNLEVIDLTELVSRNLARHRLLATTKQVAITQQLEPLPAAMVDPVKIEQLLNNLITNAVKFSAPGSGVAVRLAAVGDGAFQLVVRDEGTGLPPAVKANIYQPFPLGRAKGTAKERSNGLGLMIVKQIVDAHRGDIQFESEPGAGTTFSVTLPFEPPAESV